MVLEARARMLALQLLCAGPKQRRGSLVGFNDGQCLAVHDDHRVGRHLKQQLVARFGLARLPVATFNLLLRLDIPLLDRRDGAQIATDGEHWAVLAQPDRGVRHRDAVVGAERVIDLATPGDAGGRDLVEQILDLRPRLAADRVDPGPTDPLVGAWRDRVCTALGDVADHAGVIDDEGDVARQRDEGLRDLGCPGGKRREVGAITGRVAHGFRPSSEWHSERQTEEGMVPILRRWFGGS